MIPVLIAVLATASYASGIASVLAGSYKPSVYSRAVWLLISANSAASVFALHNAAGTEALAAIGFLGSLGMFASSWKYSVRTFGRTELACTILLGASGIVWLVGTVPLLNMYIGLTAHFIGAAPSFKSAYRSPRSENFFFWWTFAAASILAFLTADKGDARAYSYALYFMLFDSSMTLLAARKFLRAD